MFGFVFNKLVEGKLPPVFMSWFKDEIKLGQFLVLTLWKSFELVLLPLTMDPSAKLLILVV